MKGMLKKDFSLMKGQKQFFLVAFIFAFMFLFVNKMVTFGVSYLMIMFLMFTLSTITYDEYDNGYPFLFTLPISRRLYVKEKYIFCILTTTVVGVINSVLILILSVWKESLETFPDLLISCVSALGAGMLMMAVLIPVQLKFGSEKRQLAMIIGFVGVFLLIFLGSWLIDRFQLSTYVGVVAGIPVGIFIGLCIVAVILAIIISYVISVRIMEKKEF